MSKKIWILNSLEKNSDYKYREKIDEYVKASIEAGNLIKLSYVTKSTQEFFRANIEGRPMEEEFDNEVVNLYINDYTTSDKILFVYEDGCYEISKEYPGSSVNFILKDSEKSEGKDDFEIPVLIEDTKEKILRKEKTHPLSFFVALIPYIYFINGYGKKFTSVLTISTIFAVAILAFCVAKKRVNVLNVGLVMLFAFVCAIRLLNPYWINTIGPLFISLGLCSIFLTGSFFDEKILGTYFMTSKRKSREYQDINILWIVVMIIISANLVYFGQVKFITSTGLIILAWLLTIVNLRGCEVEEMLEDGVSNNENGSLMDEFNQEQVVEKFDIG